MICRGKGSIPAVFLALVLSGCGAAARDSSDVGLTQLVSPDELRVGSAVRADALEKDADYRQVLIRNFNLVTTENAAKFDIVHPKQEAYDFTEFDTIVDFAVDNDLAVRGHTLVWHRNLPLWLTNSSSSRESVLATLEQHIKSVVARHRGRVLAWDVVNEAVADDGSLRRTFWLDKLGPEYIELAFRWAHEADPSALLFYNDYGAEGLSKKSDAVLALVRDLKSRNVPIHGVGLQMHVPATAPVPSSQLARNIQRLADNDLRVHITEMDVLLPHVPLATELVRQASVFHDVTTVCREAPSCDALVFWGYTDRYSWVPMFVPGFGHATLYDENLRAKPARVAVAAALSDAP